MLKTSTVSAAFIALGTTLLTAMPSHADETSFLSSLEGKWTGQGTVVTRIGAPAISVNCTLNSDARQAALSMSGTCRGLVVVKRAIAADLTANGARYSGSYTGPSGRPSALSGNRRGNAINLTVRWNRDINGDRVAAMTIEKVGANGLRLRTTDKDGATGKTVVTSDIRLVR